jgi:Ni2+-binding GTPase involved in maturation of urease and hydrogenase
MKNPFEVLWSLFVDTKEDTDAKKVVSIRVNESLWKLYTAKCHADGKSVQDHIEQLVVDHIKADLQIKETQNGKKKDKSSS